MIRVNDRVVVNNRAGTVVDMDADNWPRVRFDDNGSNELCHPDHVLVTSTVPVRVTFAYNVGDRVRWTSPLYNEDVTTFITETVEINDGPGYRLMDAKLSDVYEEHQITAAPLPEMHDDDIEDLIAMYLRRGIQHMRTEAVSREFDHTRPVLEIRAEGEDDRNISVKFSAKWNYGTCTAEGDKLMTAITESIRRQQADKDNTPKKLPYSG